MLYEIRIHSRGGQGGKKAAKIIGYAAFLDGYDAQAFSLYGSERRGAPIASFIRIDEKKVLSRGYIQKPDCVVIMDDSLISEDSRTFNGLKEDGIVIINTSKSKEAIEKEIKKQLPKGVKVYTVNATEIALKKLGVPIVNTSMVGAFVKITKKVSQKNAVKALQEELSKKKDLLAGNEAAFEECYASVSA